MPRLDRANHDVANENTRRHGSRFGLMWVIGTDRGAGRLYRCPCGGQYWSVWGHALRHATTCPMARGIT